MDSPTTRCWHSVGDQLVDTYTGQRTGGGAGDERQRRPGVWERAQDGLRRLHYDEQGSIRLGPAGDSDQPRLKSTADLDAPKPQKGGEGIPKLAASGDADALRPRVEGADDTTVLYHGVERKEDLYHFGRRGQIKAVGRGDFDEGFYATTRLEEAVWWAGGRRSLEHREKYVVAIEVKKSQLDTLRGNRTNPWEYRLGVSYEDYKYKGIRRSKVEVEAYNRQSDYIYGDVQDYPGWEQYAFKSQEALNVLNASPRSIYRVTPDGQLELVLKVDPSNPGRLPDGAFIGLGDLPAAKARQIQAAVEETRAPVNVVGGMAKQKHHHPPSQIDVDIYIERQYREIWTPELRAKLGSFDPRPMDDYFLYESGWTKTPPGLRKPYIRFASGEAPVWVKKD